MSPTRPQPVNTDACQPPTVSIISPTPRAFTFPTSHNLSDSPYSSPSHSPFQPDLRPLAISTVTPPPPPFESPLISPASSLDSPVSTHKRRKSSTSLDVERRPKKGDEDYVKRPENAFILFRRKCCEERAAEEAEGAARKQRQADLSKTISQQWKGLSAEERQYWERLAKEKKKEHERLYPDYVYRPQRQRDKDGKVKKNKKRRGEYEHDTDSDSVTFVIPRPHGRSVSAPNRPVLYHSIQIPNVYVSPSCPASPSTPTSQLPMISRRSAHPGHPEEEFDFHPNDNLMPPLFGQGAFEANLSVSSELLRSMFSLDPHGSPLEPLDFDPSSMLHPLSSASSIGSGSSGPSSPQSGPFTPTSSTMLEHSFSQLDTSDSRRPSIHGEGDWDLPHMGMEMLQYPESNMPQDFCDSSFSWGTENSSPMWNNPDSAVMFAGDDFDVNAIPPIQLGVPKYNGELPASQSHSELEYVEFGQQQHSPDQYIDERIMGFDDMIVGRSF